MTTAHRVVLWVMGIVVGLLAIGAAVYFFVPSVKERVALSIAAMQVPADLRDLVFVGVSEQAAGPTISYYRPAFLDFSVEAVSTLAAGVALSPDGTKYVQADPNVRGGEAFGPRPVDPDQWTISLQVVNGTTETFARGYAPAFLDDDHLVYFSAGGIAVRTLSTGANRLVYSMPFSSSTPISQVQYAPNRSLVTWTNGATGETIVASLSPESYTPVHVFSGLMSPVLTDAVLYSVRATATGKELWRHAHDGTTSERVLVFPESLGLLYIQH